MSFADRARLEAWLGEALRAVSGETRTGAAIETAGGRVRVAGLWLPADASVQVVAIGKAAVPMARAALARLGDRVGGGIVVTRDGLAEGAPDVLPLHVAGHPVPDERSARAGAAVLDVAASMPRRDVMLVLLSGGASALTSCPAAGLTPADLAATSSALLACGADIHETNCVRKHVSAVGGGRLAAACEAARIVVLAISDVPGDRLDVIGSGPCEPDPSTYRDALDVVARHAIADRLPAAVRAHLEAGVAGRVPETEAPGSAALARVRSHVIARNADARAALIDAASRAGLPGVDLGEVLTGEARVVGARLAALGAALEAGGPRLVVAGGETVVRLRGEGQGGRNQELALAAAIELARAGTAGVALMASATDGADGPTDASGGLVDAGSAARARAAGVDAAAALAANDSYRFLGACGGRLESGPTGTNVMDVAMLVRGAG